MTPRSLLPFLEKSLQPRRQTSYSPFPYHSRRSHLVRFFPKRDTMSGLKSTYLTLYNTALMFGWSYVLFLTIDTYVKEGPGAVYAAAVTPLQIVQTAALLEIAHSLLGVVRSPISATLPQVASRIFLVWGVLFSFPAQTHKSIFVTSLLLSWSITEIVRYGFFAVKEGLGSAPSTLLWLRYSMFYVLYPSGIVSEVALIILALSEMKSSGRYNILMPNPVNFGLDFYLLSLLALVTYIPGGPYMYTYMMNQRKKALTPKEKAT